MAVFIYQPDAFEKISQVENELDARYLEHVEEDKWHPCSFFAFKKAWEKISPELKTKFPESTITVDSNGAIYGALGYNRYAVMYSGELCFIRDLAINSEFVVKALAAGFRII
jgi:hypothetical protein